MKSNAIELNGWLIVVSNEGDYLYITRDGSPGQVHVKAEDEGIVVDIWNDHEPPMCVSTTYAHYPELERE